MSIIDAYGICLILSFSLKDYKGGEELSQ